MSRWPPHSNGASGFNGSGKRAPHHLPRRPAPNPAPGSAVPFYNEPPAWRREPGDDRAFRHQGDYNSWMSSEDSLRASSQPPFVPAMPRHYASSSHQAPFQYNVAGPSTYSKGPYRPAGLPAPRAYSSNSSSPRQGSPSGSSAGKFVPLHLRAPLAEPRPLPSQDTPPSFRDKRPPVPEFVIPLPDKAYMELSSPNISHRDHLSGMTSKLLVLDLNGTLIYRNKGSSNSRTSYPRPYLGCFLQYLFRDISNESQERPWQVFVWSSAQPHNVRTMLESTFDAKHLAGLWDVKGTEAEGNGPGEGEGDLAAGKVLGVWARDKMGLSQQEYAHKTQTTKDLRKVEAHFGNVDTGFKDFPLETILLLDDSPLKAVYQPWNQLVLPEYDRTAYQTTKKAITQGDDETAATECDQFLLAVIGILEATSSFENIPSWIRAGGLKKPDIQDLAQEEDQKAEWGEGWLVWRGKPDGPAAGVEATLESLPTHESFKHWFQDPHLVKRWIEKGKEALTAAGIAIEHGIDPAPSVRGSPAPASKQDWRNKGPAPPLPLGHSVPATRQRGYSPSRPTTPTITETISDDTQKIEEEKPQAVQAGKQALVKPDANSASSSRQTRPYSTKNIIDDPVLSIPNPIPDRHDRLLHLDTWRTFHSADVAQYLGHLPQLQALNKQDRQILGEANRLLRRLNKKTASEGSWDRWVPAFETRAHNRRGRGVIMGPEQDEPTVANRRAKSAQEHGSQAPAVSKLSRKELRAIARQERRKEWQQISEEALPDDAADHSEYHPTENEYDPDLNIEPDLSASPRAISPATISSRTRGAKAVEIKGGAESNDGPSTVNRFVPASTMSTRLPKPNVPGVEVWSAGDMEPANAVYPLDHLTSSLSLPPAEVDGRILTHLELARYFSRAQNNPHQDQNLYLSELAMRESNIKKAALRRQQGIPTKTNTDADTARILKLRRWIIALEHERDDRNDELREREAETEACRARTRPPPPPEAISRSIKTPQKKKKKKDKGKKSKRTDQVSGSPVKLLKKPRNRQSGSDGQNGNKKNGAGLPGNEASEQGSRSSKRRATDNGPERSIKIQRVD